MPGQNHPKPLLRDIRRETLDCAAETIKLLGHPERLKIVEALDAGEATVSEICRQLQLPQAMVSHHLAKMRSRGIVAATRDGVYVRYRVIEPKVRHVLDCIRMCDT